MKTLLLLTLSCVGALANSISIPVMDRLDITQTGFGFTDASQSFTHTFTIHWDSTATTKSSPGPNDLSTLYVIFGAAGTFDPNDNRQDTVRRATVDTNGTVNNQPRWTFPLWRSDILGGGGSPNPSITYQGGDALVVVNVGIALHAAIFPLPGIPNPTASTQVFGEVTRISFVTAYDGTTISLVPDALVTSSTPEPTTLTLAGLGLLALALRPRSSR